MGDALGQPQVLDLMAATVPPVHHQLSIDGNNCLSEKERKKDPPSPMINRLKFPSHQFNTSYCFIFLSNSLANLLSIPGFLPNSFELRNNTFDPVKFSKDFQTVKFHKNSCLMKSEGISAFGEVQKCD
jgi:hypothetical protein